MDAYKSGTLKKFTSESKKHIKERILNEKSQCDLYEIESNGCFNNTFKTTTSSKTAEMLEELNLNKKPEKYLEAGKKLPKKYSTHFTHSLSGIPLEEIDDYYKNDHV